MRVSPCMRMKRIALIAAGMFVMIKLISEIVETGKCAPGWAFDPRAFECRQCGLCCMDHQVIQACLDQTSDASHACYSDASCTDPVPVMPGTPPPSADSGLNWTTIGPIVGGIIGSMAVIGVIVVLLVLLIRKFRKPADAIVRPLMHEGGRFVEQPMAPSGVKLGIGPLKEDSDETHPKAAMNVETGSLTSDGPGSGSIGQSSAPRVSLSENVQQDYDTINLYPGTDSS